MRPSIRVVIAALLTAGFVAMADAQELGPTPPVLREAQPGEVWITRPTMSAELPIPASELGGVRTLATDSTPPTAPANLVARSTGLFSISANWSPSTDPESAIDYYAFAIGTGTTPDTEANVRWWQSNGRKTTVKISLALTQGSTYYFSVRARNGAGQYSVTTRSGPLTATPATYGQDGNQITYVISPVGIDANGGETSSYPPDQLAALTDFVDKMLPVLRDLYGPPSSSYTFTIVRDLRYTSSAVFFPSTDEIHMGESPTYQLLTHEMVHAFRRDRNLSSGSVWQYEPTLSGFEEGFAQAVSYQAMTEFARRYPDFGLSQKIYQSSHEWDYDFQNVPNLRTTDLWSDSGGMNLHWVRYEMAAAAIRKIELEHPGFHRAFNVEYYRRLNLDPQLRTSRGLVKDIIQTVAPTIEGKPASQWIDAQYIFDCAFHPGKKIWLLTQHYQGSSKYLIFNRVFFHETFSNGSDWAYPDGAGGYIYHHLNGSAGTATLRTSSGDVVWQRALLMTPVDNPPVYYGFGVDEVNLTTEPTNLPWPGGDLTKFVTSLLPFDLYRLTIEFTAGTTVTNDSYQVIGAPLRNTRGVFGGVVGGNGGRIYLNHRQYPPQPPASVENGVFWTIPQWASLSHPATNSVDTAPGVVDVTYIDAAGNIYKDVRTIEYGSWDGSQAFLFDVAHMTPAPPEAPSIVTQPSSQAVSVGQTLQFAVAATGTPLPAYQWQVSTNGGSSWANLTNGAPYSGVDTATMVIASAGAGLNGNQFRALATNSAGNATSSAATLTVDTLLTITGQPANQTVTAGQNTQFTVAASGIPAPAYQWQRSIDNGVSWANLINVAPYSGADTASLSIAGAAASLNGCQFRVLVTNGATAMSNAATLTVVAGPSITAQPSDVTVTAGQLAQFAVAANGVPSPTYRWQVSTDAGASWTNLSNTQPFVGVLTPSLTVTNVPVSFNLARYRCVVSNASGSTASQAATLRVIDLQYGTDFDGDGKAELTVDRPSNGLWYALLSSTNYATYLAQPWGLPTDIPVPGDYDGDGKTDIAAYRPSTGVWYVQQSSTTYQWGTAGDIPVPADYDGDGRTDIATYRPADGRWSILTSGSGFSAGLGYLWGAAGDIPISEDYDGDTRADLIVYRPSTGHWFVLLSTSGYTSAIAYQWGTTGDVPVPGDFDGDGRMDVAVYRPTSGAWYILKSSTGYSRADGYFWGADADIPMHGDYDGDGRTDLAVYRPSSAVWFILKSTSQFKEWLTYQWGQTGDVPIPGRRY